MTFEDQLKTLIFFHLEEHTSAQHFLQVLEKDDFARAVIAPEDGIKKSSFSEAINFPGLEQLVRIYQNLQSEAIRAFFVFKSREWLNPAGNRKLPPMNYLTKNM